MGVSTGLRWPPKLMSRTVLLFLGVTTLIVGTWAQDCNSNAQIPTAVTNIVQFDKCQLAWQAENFNLRFKQDTTAQTLSVLLSIPRASRWYAMGFNTQAASMPGTQSIIFWVDEATSVPTVGTYTVNGKSRSSIVEGDTTLKFTVAPAVTVTTDYLYLTYVVEQLPTDNQLANINFAKGPSGDTTFSQQHESESSLAIDYQTGGVTAQTSNIADKAKTHGILNIVGWGVLLPLGAIVARYAKAYDPTWFYMHAVFQIIGYILIIAGFVLGFQLENDLKGLEGLNRHKNLAIILFVLASIQIAAGVFRPKKDAKVRRYWNWGHWWIGRSALLVAAINIFVGIHIGNAGQKWKVAYGVIVGLELLAVIPLEIILWVKYLRARDEPRLPQTTMQGRVFDSEEIHSSVPRDPPPYSGATNWDEKH